MYRNAVVKGLFYPNSADETGDFIRKNISHEEKVRAKMVLVPHAGYVFSGATAVKTLSSVEIPETVVLLGPNHTGAGENIAVYPGGSWETPLGDIKVNKKLTDKLINSGFLPDEKAHMKEHSLEVQMPILKYLRNNVKVVPIAFKSLGYGASKKIASTIYDILKDDDILILVSSDFNHFENIQITNDKDSAAISKILEMDTSGLFDVVMDKNISMCGAIPAVVGLEMVKRAGYESAVLVEHTTSADVSGDISQVVGYAGIIIK